MPRFRSRRTVGLLGYLAAEGRPVAREHLAALFWPDETPSRGRANLSRELHNLTQVLPDSWETNRRTVAFVAGGNTVVDLYLIQHLEGQERWVEAAELLCGEFLEGLHLDDNPEFETWLLGERERWHGRAEAILARVVEGRVRRGRYADALRFARRLLRLSPWDEATHSQVMRLLAWTGQQGAALRQFESCRAILWEELGVRPSAETIALCRQIRTGRLDFPPQLPAFLSEEKARHAFERPPFVGREEELAWLDAHLEAALAGRGRVIFITGGPGRGKTALLHAFAGQAMAKHLSLLVVSGRCNAYSGIGDPYLPYRDALAMLAGDVEGQWDAGAISQEHARRLWAAFPSVIQAILDYGPQLLDVLVSGTTLLSRAVAAGHESVPWLPRLREQIKRKPAAPEGVERSPLFQQTTDVLRIVAQEQPLLLILDDIQWADAASIGLLFHLGRRLADADCKLLVACAYRAEEVALDRRGERHPLAKVSSEFKRAYGNRWIDLGQAEDSKERRFTSALLDTQPNRLGDGFRAALFDRTGGHPLFTVELLRAMQGRGDLRQAADGTWIEGPTLDWELLPARVEAVIAERIDRLDPELEEILAIASVEGERFRAQVVAEVRNMPERAVLRLLSQELERRHRLVREEEEAYSGQIRLSCYRFGHILFQDYLYKRLGRGEKQLLHGRVAAALEKLYRDQLEEVVVPLAQHFFLAGNRPKAFHYACLAAERATHLYESEEAIAHYGRAIELANSICLEAASLARLYHRRGLAFGLVGDFASALSDFKLALQLARSAGEHQVAWRAQLDLGRLWASRDYNEARSHFDAALELARAIGEPGTLAVSLNWMGNWWANEEEFQRAVGFHQEALTIVEDLGDRQELANTLDLLGLANLLGGDLDTSVHYYNRAVILSQELDDRQRLASGMIGRATNASVLAWLGSAPTALPRDPCLDMQEALQVAREIGSASEEIWARWSTGLLQTVRGKFGLAANQFHSGLARATAIGHREWIVGNQVPLAYLYTVLFAPARAVGQLAEAEKLARELRSLTWIRLVAAVIAGAHLIVGDVEATRACLEKAISPHSPMDSLGKRFCWLRRAELALAEDEVILALNIIDRLIASAPGMSPGRVITYPWLLKAEALTAMGQLEEACFLLHAALENAEAAEECFLLWRLHASLGRLWHAMDRREAAGKEIAVARALIDELAATVPEKKLRDNFRRGAHNAAQIIT